MVHATPFTCHRDPLVRFYGIGPDALYNHDWSTYPIPPPLLIWQIYIGEELDNETEKTLVRDLSDLNEMAAQGTIEAVSIISHSKFWARYTKDRLQVSVIKYIEIRILSVSEHSEVSLVYDGRSTLNVGSFISIPVDKVGDSMANSFLCANGPRILHIASPISSRFLSASDLAVDKVMALLKLRCLLLKCTIPLDLFSKIQVFLDFFRKTPTCDDLEFLEPVSFSFLRLGDAVRKNYTHNLAAGLLRVQHLRTLAVPLSVINSTIISCLSLLPHLEVLRIRPGESKYANTAALFLKAVFPSREHIDNGFKKLKVLDINVHASMGVDTVILPAICEVFSGAMVYQSFMDEVRTTSWDDFAGMDLEELLKECNECFKRWGDI